MTGKKVAAVVLIAVIVVGGITVMAYRHKMDMAVMPMASNQSAVATTSVSIQNYAFGPGAIKVKPGDTVTWTNQDNVHHTITIDNGSDGPKSSELGQGQKYTYTFKTAGAYSYHCEIHPEMHGTVQVGG